MNHSVRKLTRAACLLGALVLSGSTVVACGGQKESKFAHVKPGPMPEGESWTGVYYHPVFGYLHMEENDSNIHGRWKRTDQSAWGELSGTISGNVVHFQWKEHTYGMIGPASERKGRGVFVYKANDDGTPVLEGQYGNDDSEVGGDWKNVKQTRMQPDMKSIGGASPEETVRPGGLE